MDVSLKIKYQGKELDGILVKESNDEILFKLNNGYNVIIPKKDFEIISRKDIEKNQNKTNKTLKNNPKLPNILLLHTGGTIASKVDYETGAVSSQVTPQEILDLYPELSLIANMDSKLVSNLSSEDIRFDHYNLLLNEINLQLKKNKYAGIIVSHGTDTMHYTSAALSYALENLSVPVILVGSQRSSDRPSSDAYLNLKAATEFISYFSEKKHSFRRVGICMQKTLDNNSFTILDGINARKMHTTRRDAFKQINYKPFAQVSEGRVTVLRENLLSSLPSKPVKFTEFDCNLKIGFFKAHPNLFSDEILNLKIYDGVVIEGTGLGHLGVSKFDDLSELNEENLKALEKVQQSTKVIMSNQCVNGVTNMNIYSSGRRVKNLGIKGNNSNLTSETLFVRLAYCLSNKNLDFNELWDTNLESLEPSLLDLEID